MRLYFVTLLISTIHFGIRASDSTAIESYIDEAGEILFADPIRAGAMADSIINLSNVNDYKLGMHYGLTFKGHSLYFQGKLDDALKSYTHSLEYSKAIDDVDLCVNAYLNISYTYDRVGMSVLAEDLLRKSQSASGRLSIKSINDINLYFGYHYQLLDQMDSAQFYYGNIDLKSVQNDPSFKGFYYMQQAKIALLDNDFGLAKAHLETSEEIASLFDNKWDLINLELAKGELAFNQNDYEIARSYIDNALAMMEATGVDVDRDRAYEMLYTISKQFDDKDLTLSYFEKIREIEQRNNEVNRTVQNMATAAFKENSKQQINNIKLQSKIDAQHNSVYLRNTVIAFILVLLGISVFITYAAVKSSQRLVRAKDKIESQRDDLKQLNIAKNRLLAMLSHDIKNPVNSIVGMLGLAKDQVITQEEFQEFAVLMEGSTNRLTSQIQNLLNWSKSQFNNMNVQEENFDLNVLIKQCIDNLLPIAEAKNQVVRFDSDETALVYADQNMISIVISNVLTNAIKYSDTNGTINFAIENKGEDTILKISDAGIGMSTEILDGLFKSTMESTKGTNKETGFGIGLLLAYDLVVMNNGRIWAESEEGSGSTFFIALPQAINSSEDDLPPQNKGLAILAL